MRRTKPINFWVENRAAGGSGGVVRVWRERGEPRLCRIVHELLNFEGGGRVTNEAKNFFGCIRLREDAIRCISLRRSAGGPGGAVQESLCHCFLARSVLVDWLGFPV